jgi:hypothetical protein
MAHDVYMVGSVPMANAEAVFTAVAAALGSRIKRIPDGETGHRLDWITWLETVFADNPALEQSDELFRVHPSAVARKRYRLKPGKSVTDIRFDNLFYADNAKESYAAFKRLRDAGKIASWNALPGRSRAGAFGAVAVHRRGPASSRRSHL